MADSNSKLSFISSFLCRPKFIICLTIAAFFIINVLNPSSTPRVSSALHRRSSTESLTEDNVASHSPIEARADRKPVVKLAQGTLNGKVITDRGPKHLDSFLGVRYAEPPTGDWRFGRTRIVGPSGDSFPATKYGARCPSRSLDGKWSEDCLFCNVYVPQGTPADAKLPVMVYIHGGSFQDGWAGDHDSANMVGWSENDFIAVGLHYRLGALGFLAGSAVKEHGLPNAGLQDQVLLLEWVQANIAAFGGDPNRVTIVGFSSGAHAVGHHIMHQTEKKLFHQAILESGSVTARHAKPVEDKIPEAQFKAFAVEAGCGDSSGNEETMKCLRSQDVEKIVKASSAVFSRYAGAEAYAFQPVVDGDMVAKAPIDAWLAGEWNKVPLFTGFSTDEASQFVPDKIDTSEAFDKYFKNRIPWMTDDEFHTLNHKLYLDPSIYPDSFYKETRPISVGSQFKRLVSSYGHYRYICPAKQTAHFAADDVRVYLHSWPMPDSMKYGAKHGVMVEYEEYQTDRCGGTPAHKKLAGYTHAYYTSFITTGDPNTVKGPYGDRPEWKPFHPTKAPDNVMVFGEKNNECLGGDDGGTAAELKETNWLNYKCDFWFGII